MKAFVIAKVSSPCKVDVKQVKSRRGINAVFGRGILAQKPPHELTWKPI